MSSPMYDPPEHFQIGLTVNGEGPAFGDDLDHYGCWCSDPECVEWKAPGETMKDDTFVGVDGITYTAEFRALLMDYMKRLTKLFIEAVDHDQGQCSRPVGVRRGIAVSVLRQVGHGNVLQELRVPSCNASGIVRAVSLLYRPLRAL